MFAAGPNFREPGGESRNSPPKGGELENSARVTQLSPQFAALPCKFCPSRELLCLANSFSTLAVSQTAIRRSSGRCAAPLREAGLPRLANATSL